MDVRSPLFQNIACILMGVMFLNPIVSTAAELTVDAAAGGNTNLGSAPNGVPVVNIATPNGSGLSHNKFTDYNVGQQGLILNNGTAAFNQTQLGGVILGNSNLNGRAANLILNEVTGGNQSQLKGYTEVAGQGAHVVVANPHGITCDGCGFINTPRATLTTGTPVIDNGRLDHFDVNGGEINVEGAGLNASNISQFDLITRSAKLNAQLQAQRLNIIAGRNDVDAATLAATAKADDANGKPLLAIDSSALGGMYAGAIRLVGTEAGVGVKLAADMAASGEDIQIDANGKLTVARVASAGSVTANAKQIELTDTVYASNNASFTAEQIDIASSLASGANLTLTSAQTSNNGSLEAGVKADGSGNRAAVLNLQGSTVNNNGSITSQGNLNTDLQQLNNSGKKVLAVGNATVKATNINNSAGQIVAQQALTITGDTLDNSAGTIASNKALSLTLANTLINSADGLLLSKADGLTIITQTLINAGGSAQADASELKIISSTTVNSAGTLQGDSVNLSATGTLINDGGRIAATQGQATLTGGAISNNAGTVLAKTTLKTTASSLNSAGGTLGANSVDLDLAGHLDNSSGLIESDTTLLLKAGSLSNGGGKLRALGSTGSSQFEIGGLFNNDGGLVEIGNSQLSLTSAGLSNQSGNVRHLGNQFALALADVGNAGGSFITNGELTLNVADWTNSSQLQAQKISLTVGTFTQTASGALRSVESITATGDTWQNDGSIETDGALSLTLTGAYSGNGALLSAGDLTVTAASVDTGANAQWKTAGKADFTVGGELLNRGSISAAQNLIARANSLNNFGTLGAATTLRTESASLRNEGGLIFSGADMVLRTDSFTNLRADVYSLGTLSIAKDDANAQLSLLENRSGSIESAGDMSLRAAVFSNRKELFRTEKTQIYGQVATHCYDCGGDHHNVDYIATEIFQTTVAEDSAAARISSGANLDIQGGALSNQYSTLAATGAVTITGTSLENLGASTGTVQRVRTYNTGRVTDGTEERFRENYVDPYNAQGFPKTISSNFSRWNLLSDIETDTPTGIAAPAIIQAGGNVTIQATQPISNASVMANQAPQPGAAPTLDTTVLSGTQPLVVQLNAQLPPDAAQQGVNPITLPSFSLPQGQNGLFHVNTDPSHPYLVESNPAFASLRNFISSDYLLGIIGYNADLTQRRLGDGLYEQRLVQDAIVARTGKRFLDGLASDEAQFKYLMDNAIASKAALNLVPGIALSAEQVAALTHDIVWMQEQEVNGQKVLVPVLYLAQATDRLAPSGALIQGRDVALISGSDLTNSGTLRASQNLSLSGGNINNSGLAQANERLSMLATDSIRNTAGGILKGKDVSLVAVAGDVTNQRNIATDSRSGKNFSTLTSVVDNAARIEAGNDLVVSAGRDMQNTGGAISAGKNADLSAGRDLVIAAAEAENGQMRKDKRHFWETTSTTQYGSDVKVGSDLTAKAGNDLTVVASTVKATGDIALQAGKDVTIAAAANDASSEYHYKGNGKKIDKENRTVRQQASVIEAGGDLDIAANNDLTVSSSQLQAGNEAYLYAKGDIQLEAAQNEDYSYSYKMKKSSGFLSSSKKSKLTEQTQITNVGSTITSKGDAVLIAKNDIRVMGSTIESTAADVSLVAGNDVQIGAVSDLTQRLQNQKSSKTSWGGYKSGKAANDVSETSTQAVGSLISGDNVSIQAARDAEVTGSGVVGTHDVELVAGRDLKVDAATNTFNREEKYKVKSRDFTGILTGNNLGLDDITGKQHLSISNGKGNSSAAETTLSGSTIGSSEGNVSLTAGRKLDVVASDLVSTKDLALTGSDVTIAAGIETAKQSSKDSSSSLAVGRVIGGQIVDAAKSIRNDLQAARDADDSRLKAVKIAQAGLSAYNAYNTGDTAAANISEGKPANSSGSLIKIGTEVASTRSKSMSEYSSETAKQASLLSGGSLSIVATGANTEGDIHVVGSSLTAEDTLLAAKRNITLESAQNSAEWENKNSTNRISVGASFNIGQQNGFTIDLGAQAAKGKGTGNSVEQVNSSLDTGTLILRSGQDTTVAGAQVHAETLNAQVGGNLNIASRQDGENSKNKQVSGGVGMSICVPPICYGSTVSGSANIAASKTNSAYEAVMDQSGLFAGKGGYNIIVGKTTDLHGAVIASEASADKNLLSTDRLVVSDIKNRSELTSQAASISVSYSSDGATKKNSPVKGSSGMGGGIPLQLTDDDHSATRSAVSEGSITVRSADGANDLVGLNRDTANANQALDKPDQKAMQERMDLIQSTAELGESIANTVAAAKQKEASEKASKAKTDDEIKAAVAAQNEADAWKAGGDKRVIADVMTGLVAAGLGGTSGGTTVGIVANTAAADTFNAIGNYAAKKKREAESDGDTAMAAAWAEGGAARVLLHALAGAVQGLAGGNAGSGALGAGASAALMPAIAKALETSGLSETDQNALAALVAAGVGATAASGTDLGGQIAAGGSAAGVDLYNRQLHPDEIVFLSNQERVNRYIAYIKAQKGETLTPEEALKALNQSGAALADLKWEQVRAGDALTIMFIQQEAAAAGGGYLNADGSLHPLFAVSREEYLDERINLKALFDSYGKSAATTQYLSDNVVTGSSWAERFRAGQELGQIDAGKGYEGATGVAGGLAADVGAIFKGFGSIPDALWGEKSDEIGPIDSERMSSYYQALLHLQDRAEEAGYVSEFEWATAQRLGIVGLPVGELTGLALLKAVKVAAKPKAGVDTTVPVTEKGPCCFAAGTMVATPEGSRAIETLKVGDIVWSKPEKGGKPFAAAILATHQRTDQPIYRLKLKSVRANGVATGETLLVTPSHPFYVPAKHDFIPVKDLKPGDLLQSLADGETDNTSSEIESLELYLPQGKTYNLTVDVGHTFYVGELKTWVHNTGPCDISGSGNGSSGPGKAVDQVIPPGMERPFRPVNPEFPANAAVVDAMDSPQIKNMVTCGGVDCSEIADKLLEVAKGNGKIIEVRPTQQYTLNLYENGQLVDGQVYHQVYTDGRYVYDPRLSSQPIPKGDWEQHIKGMNPNGVSISEKLKGL